MCMEHTDPSAVGFEDSLMRYFPEVNTLLYTFPSGTFCHNTACCRVVRLDCSVPPLLVVAAFIAHARTLHNSTKVLGARGVGLRPPSPGARQWPL